MADDNLAIEPEPGVKEARLAIAVRGLVEVHEIHVNRGPGEIAIELGVEMEKGLAQRRQSADPHL